MPAVGLNSDGSGEVFRLNLELGRFMRPYEVGVGGGGGNDNDDTAAAVGTGALQGSVGVGSVNRAAVAEQSHNLLAFGTSLGTVEFWDARSRSRVGVLSVPRTPPLPSPADGADAQPERDEITALAFHMSGLTLATGTAAGLVYLYDLRSPTPLLKKDQGYGYPIHTVTFLTPSTESARAHAPEPKVLSADKKIVKLWDARDGRAWTSVEPDVDLHAVEWCRDTGLLLTANEGRPQHSFFIPQLGPAPHWCRFLDSLVEEMADDPHDPLAFRSTAATAAAVGEVYEGYKFVTPAQLRALNLEHLIGRSGLLRPYMHGYFVAQQLYDEARLIADPFIWEQERMKRVQAKIEKERESRIRGGGGKVKSTAVNVKVNRQLAEKIVAREEKKRQQQQQAKSKRAADESDTDEDAEEHRAETKVDGGDGDDKDNDRRPKLLKDTRFAALFQDEDFIVDEQSREFQLINPSTKIPKGRTAAEIEEEEMADRRQYSDSEDDEVDDDDNDDDEEGRNGRGSRGATGARADDTDEEDGIRRDRRHPARKQSLSSALTRKRRDTRPQHVPRLQFSASSSSAPSARLQQRQQQLSFQTRLARNEQRRQKSGDSTMNATSVVGGRGGEREITFSVRSGRGGKGSKVGGGGEGRGQGRGQGRRDPNRRSASNNVMRSM